MPSKIIGGRIYDTVTAHQLVTKWTDLPLDDEGNTYKYRESLYLKDNGIYFIYSKDGNTGEWSIRPLRNKKKAIDWCLENFDAEKAQEIWGAFPE